MQIKNFLTIFFEIEDKEKLLLTRVISFLVFLFRFSFNVNGDDVMSFPFDFSPRHCEP